MAILTIGTCGQMEQIRPGKGKGFDLRKTGYPVEIRRSSLIEFDAKEQGFYVQFIDGSKACAALSSGKLCPADLYPLGLSKSDLPESFRGGDGTGADLIYFNEYEDAVTAEVLILERWRLAGRLPIA